MTGQSSQGVHLHLKTGPRGQQLYGHLPDGAGSILGPSFLNEAQNQRQ